ncbi:hypothetical protein [Domibacillus sp. A3M-37]|uniref:hypothetical protein n=1 Tax=Domibacillus sp. A3M-37 TaxID=2962037 RepID=UPI0035BFB008
MVAIQRKKGEVQELQSAFINTTPYKGKEAEVTTYLLKEKQLHGDRAFSALYKVEGKVVGGIGLLEN